MSRLLLLLLFACFTTASAAAQDRPQILIVAGGDSMLPATRIMSDEIERGLEAGLGRDVDVFVEFLDAIRFPEPGYQELVGELITTKHGSKDFDLIFALGPPAYDFVARHRSAPYLTAPVVYLAMRDSTIEKLPVLHDATGIVSRFDLLETVRLAELLQPGLQNLFVITGSSDFDRSWEEAARRELAAFPSELTISYLADLRLEDLMLRLNDLPRGSALLYLTMFQDHAGNTYMAPEIAEKLAAAAPVYSVYSTYLDRGIIGGHMDTFEGVGKAGADLGLRILSGEDASSIPPGPVDPQTFVVNWPVLQHWNLDASRLPEDTIILNRQISIWDEYKEQILVFMTLLLLQTLLIIALLAQGRRKRLAEVRLEESEDRMRLAARAANLGLWRWDSDTNKVWMTDHCRNMLGLARGKVLSIGQLLATIHREDRRALQRQIDRSARWHTPFDTECRIVLPEGSMRWLSIKGQSTQNATNHTGRVTGVVTDISERKNEQLEAELQRNQLTHLTRVSILGELSGAMAHELNQPLTAILSNAQAGQQLLGREPPDLEEVNGILADIVADDLRAGEVIQRLRRLLKRDETRFENLDISDVASEVVELARSELLTHQVTLEIDCDPELPPVLGDRIQLQQVFLNLIMNACEAMTNTTPTARALTVKTRESGQRDVEIVVSDSGPGIAEDMLEQLFEPFSTTKQKGLGLGLSISRAIVAAHNGQIQVHNGNGSGATFTVRLPSAG